MNVVGLINNKRNNINLTKEDIQFIIDGYMDDSIKDYQMSALLMAICINGMNDEEIFNLTKAILSNGKKIDLSLIEGIKVDKHSTGGVGDKTTLVISPLVASCGVIIPKISGRGLGHTGGTADKLEAIKNFNVNLASDELTKQLQAIGVVIATSSFDLVPVDKKMYALRDVTGTVSSLPLIAASIMSKKIATGADKIVLDVKVGRGALIATKEEGKTLAEIMINIGKRFGKETIAIVSNMDYPLGNNIGNGLEVIEAIDILNGKGNKDLRELCIILASYMVSLGKNIPLEEARLLVETNIDNGKAYNKFVELVNYQQGDINNIAVSDNIIEIKTNRTGYINDIDALKIGKLSMNLGAGRRVKEDIIDYGAGISLVKKINDFVNSGDVIARVYMGNKKIPLNEVEEAFIISDKITVKKPLIYEVIIN